jgi:hypothetical protein
MVRAMITTPMFLLQFTGGTWGPGMLDAAADQALRGRRQHNRDSSPWGGAALWWLRPYQVGRNSSKALGLAGSSGNSFLTS